MIPAFAAVAAIPDTVIAALYGERWVQAAVLLTPLALAMPVNAILAVGGPVMSGLGAAGKDAVSQLVCAVILIVGVWLAASISLVVVAWTVLGVYLLRALLVAYLVLGMVAGTWGQFARALTGPFALGVLAALLIWVTNELLLKVVPVPMPRMLLDIGFTGMVTGALLLWMGRYLLSSETRSISANIAPRLPAPFAACMKNWEPAR